mgnify:CR=1 FL=1
MRAVLTRVKHASVTIDGEVHGQIGEGFLILLGVTHEDTEAQAVKLADKLTGLRIFEDENGKMNLALDDVGGKVIVVSNFTLCADCGHGKRPSFINAQRPIQANELYEYIIDACKKEVPVVKTGVFGAEMEVALINDGPFTIILDSKDLA